MPIEKAVLTREKIKRSIPNKKALLTRKKIKRNMLEKELFK